VTSVAGTLPDRSNTLSHPGRRRTSSQGGPCLAALDTFFAERFGDDAEARAVLEAAWSRAFAAYEAGGADEAADRLASSLLACDALTGLAVEGVLDRDDAKRVATILSEESGNDTPPATLLELYLGVAGNPLLASLPPLFAVETALQLLLHFDLVSEASLWIRPQPNRLECAVSIGDDEPSRRMRVAARMALGGSRLANPPLSQIRAVQVRRWGRADAALVVRVTPDARPAAATFLDEAARALTPLLERALLLERSIEREAALVKGSERRLTRLGFDLHDGPIQDVLMLAADAKAVRDTLSPLVPEEHRERAFEQLESLRTRLGELDAELRHLAHSLESSSAVSRPIEEVLHREVEAFSARTGTTVDLRVDGQSSFLSASQRIALFRAAQEALSNIREHSGAASVRIVLRSRRAWTELTIADDGRGFAVEQGLARAAQRGRLGLIGIHERVRMLGGSFNIESAEGGPTRLTVTLPRWEPLDPSADDGS
jgi:signal transduction histidine kinase